MEEKSRPIIMCFEGVAGYVATTISCAEKHGNFVVLIGDNNNKDVCKNWISIDQIDLSDYRKFRECYKHLSTNSYMFELRCFKRYFLTYEYLRREKIEECIMCDADVLLYENMSAYDFGECDVSITRTHIAESSDYDVVGPHCSFWKTSTLKKFLDYLFVMYGEGIAKLEEIWKYYSDNQLLGGVSDMTLLHLFVRNNDYVKVKNWSNLASVSGEEVCIDDCINDHRGYYENEFEFDGVLQMKRVRFKDGYPYFFRSKQSSEHPVKVLSIHAQGNAKKYVFGFEKEINNVLYYFMVKYVDNVFSRLNVYKTSYYKKLIKKNERVVIYGIGCRGEELYRILRWWRKKIVFCDKKAAEGVKKFHGIKVITIDELVQEYTESIIIITVDRYFEEIKEDLVERGMSAEKIY